MKRVLDGLVWQTVVWQRPFEIEAVQELLTHLATTVPRGPVIWEVRGTPDGIVYLLGCEKQHVSAVSAVLRAHGRIQFAASGTARSATTVSTQIKVSRPGLALKTDAAPAVLKAALAALAAGAGDQETVLQIVLGPSHAPTPLPGRLPDPHASWWQVITGNVGSASPESRAAIHEKTAHHSFAANIRVGADGTDDVARARITQIINALKVLESSGVYLTAAPEHPDYLDTAKVPPHFPLRLSVKELAGLFLLPVGEEELPGIPGLHPKRLPPPIWYQNPSPSQDRSFAVATGGVSTARLSISPRDALEHTIILGPTGSGKSTAMQNLILADIRAGRGVLVIDPKADLVNDILRRAPDHRTSDIVVIDPSDPNSVGFNPFYLRRIQNTGLIADAILAVFKAIFAENWGIRSQDILSGALLTLAQTEGASLIQLPPLLTDDRFRRVVTAQINDKIGLEPFWAGFEAMKESERSQNIAPVMNKLRQFLLRPGLRNVLGQIRPKFSLSGLFDRQKIVLVSLNKGIIGAETARLLGSLIVGMTWTLALSRANEPAERRNMVSVFIDELQDYLSLPTDLSDALAQARGLGVALTLAHQYRDQLPPNIRAGVDTNARNKIVFGLSVGDAKDMAAMAPGLLPEDFMALPRYHVYTSFQQGGRNTGWVSGKTFPPPPPIRDADALRRQSMTRYGRPAAEIEAEYLAVFGYPADAVAPETAPAPGMAAAASDPPAIGRKKRTTPKDEPIDLQWP